MKTGTITFHWATNYGAVLQAYALQQAMIGMGYDTEIINYIPRRVLLRDTMSDIYYRRFSELKLKKNKEKLIENFRKNELILSKRFPSDCSIKRSTPEYSAVVCGSDQVWNESFTLNAEGGPTLTYYLDFCEKNTKRIAYAVSFGTEKLRDSVKNLVKPELDKFSAISVRENSGKAILNDLGKDCSVVADPTLLLDRTAYEKLADKSRCSTGDVFTYILHNNQITARKISDFARLQFSENSPDDELYGLYDWLKKIKNSKLVITNSFHGVVLSTILHTPFIAVPVEQSGMNDRIYTFLDSVGMTDKILESYDESKIKKIIETPVDFSVSDALIADIKKRSLDYLGRALKDE